MTGRRAPRSLQSVPNVSETQGLRDHYFALPIADRGDPPYVILVCQNEDERAPFIERESR
jgi:hypothetical protein